jgi:NAD-dependent dihydropyrimidine dehydrogenase PreA subunit
MQSSITTCSGRIGYCFDQREKGCINRNLMDGKSKAEGTSDQPGLVQGLRDLRGVLSEAGARTGRQDKAVAVRLEDCIACRLCELRCPDLAIEVLVAKTTEEKVS